MRIYYAALEGFEPSRAIARGRSRSARPEDRADDVRDLLTELLELREEWRHANGTGN